MAKNIQGPRSSPQSEPDDSTALTPRCLCSSGLPPYFSPQHGTFATPSQRQGFGESDHFSISNSTPRSILGRQERPSSFYSTPRNQRYLEFGRELGLTGPDEVCPICDAGANGNTEDGLGHIQRMMLGLTAMLM